MNKFLSSGDSGSVGSGDGNTVAVDDGTVDIYGKTLSATNLIPDLPLTVNSDRQIYSTASLKVFDIETDGHDSINDELQKIYNIQSATEADPYITAFQGEIHVSKLKSASHNTGIEFDVNGNMGLTSDGYSNISATTDLRLIGGTVINNFAPKVSFRPNFETSTTKKIEVIGKDNKISFIEGTTANAYIEEKLGSLNINGGGDIAISSAGSLNIGATAETTIVGSNINMASGKINVLNLTNNKNIDIDSVNNQINFNDGLTKKASIEQGSLSGVGTDLILTADTLSVKKADATGDFFRVWNQGTHTNFELKDSAGTTIGRFDTIGTGGQNTLNINSYEISGASDGKITMNAVSGINFNSDAPSVFSSSSSSNTTSIDGATQRIEMKEGATSKFYIQETLLGTSINSTNGMFFTNDLGDIIITANGQFKTNQTPTENLSVVNKQYLDANTQPKPALYILSKEGGTDYDPASAPIHTIETSVAGEPAYFKIGWNNSGSSGGIIQVNMGMKYPSMYATTSIADGTQYITNNYKYMPSNPTTPVSYSLNTNYIVNGALATCVISPLVAPSSPPVAPIYPVIKITVHTVEVGNSPYSYMMMVEQF